MLIDLVALRSHFPLCAWHLLWFYSIIQSVKDAPLPIGSHRWEGFLSGPLRVWSPVQRVASEVTTSPYILLSSLPNSAAAGHFEETPVSSRNWEGHLKAPWDAKIPLLPGHPSAVQMKEGRRRFFRGRTFHPFRSTGLIGSRAPHHSAALSSSG